VTDDITQYLLGLRELVYFVPDVAEARAWYETVLGQAPQFNHPDYCAFALGRQQIGLHPADAKTAPGVGGQVGYWLVSDFDAVLSRLLAHGARLYRGPMVGVDGVRVCQVLDPFGNAIGLVTSASSTPDSER
jgi:predicted enzyme related to lactoylglutathione lyase